MLHCPALMCEAALCPMHDPRARLVFASPLDPAAASPSSLAGLQPLAVCQGAARRGAGLGSHLLGSARCGRAAT